MRGRFLSRWVLAVTIGEALGFAAPTAVGIALVQAGVAGPIIYAAAVVAGAIEGALLGLGQWIGFGAARPAPWPSWVAATAAGAAVAWSIGGLLLLLENTEWGSWLALGAAALGGTVLLAAIPTLQWVVLRTTVPRCAWWIPANMGAWAVALLWTFAPSPLVDESTPTGVLLTVYGTAGLLMALTVALLTGLAARRLVYGRRS